jgi:predicted ester cyclase
VKFRGIEFNRFANGKLVEHYCNFDNIAMLQQIGALPA